MAAAMALIPPFLDALAQEIDATGEIVRALGLRVISVYMGGGTPTTLSAPQLDALCGRLAAVFDLSGIKEYTAEAGRPDTITEEKLRVLKARGVTRVSVNPQTMENLLSDIVHHNLQNRAVALLENGSWAPTSGALMHDALAVLPGTRFLADPVTIRSSPKADTLEALDRLADTIALEIIPPLPVFPADEPAVAKPLIVEDNAFFKFTYGVEVLTTRVDGKDYGCVINTAGQVAASTPRKVTISCIKKNNTCDMWVNRSRRRRYRVPWAI